MKNFFGRIVTFITGFLFGAVTYKLISPFVESWHRYVTKKCEQPKPNYSHISALYRKRSKPSLLDFENQLYDDICNINYDTRIAENQHFVKIVGFGV